MDYVWICTVASSTTMIVQHGNGTHLDNVFFSWNCSAIAWCYEKVKLYIAHKEYVKVISNSKYCDVHTIISVQSYFNQGFYRFYTDILVKVQF